MNNKIYVSCKNNKAYSPIGIMDLFEQAVKENNGDIEAIFKKKQKYKNLLEMWHGSFLALALYKKFGPQFKFYICQPEKDPPDLYFIHKESGGILPVEIMELYKYKDNFKSYEELAKHIWKKKGVKKYDRCYLLLASRLSTSKFNVTKFLQELKNFTWDFQKIYLSLYMARKQQWTFFEIFSSSAQYSSLNYMYFNKEDKQFLY